MSEMRAGIVDTESETGWSPDWFAVFACEVLMLLVAALFAFSRRGWDYPLEQRFNKFLAILSGPACRLWYDTSHTLDPWYILTLVIPPLLVLSHFLYPKNWTAVLMILGCAWWVLVGVACVYGGFAR